MAKVFMLPAAQGTCPDCATKHEPEQPHNQQSLFYQTLFQNANNGRGATWEDAMEHCSDEVKELWRAKLKERGIDPGKV